VLSYLNNIRVNFITKIFFIVVAISVTGSNISINSTNGDVIVSNNNTNNTNNLNENPYKTSKQQHTSDIPKNISVIPELLDKGYLTLSAISYNNTIEFARDLDDELLPFGLNSWHQFIKFIPNYENQAQNHNLTISNLLIGKIGNFNSFDELLKEAMLYQDVPINSTVIIELPNNSVSFMIAEVRASNPESGIYYGLFDGNQNEDKSEINPKLESTLLKTSDPLSIKTDGSLYNITRDVVCYDISKFGYRQCN
jgi:hypothetical protein